LTDVDTDSLREQIETAVTSRLVADVPVGVFLSGGIDSSLIATVAAKHHPGIDTFSMGFEEARCDESLYAKAVASHIGSTHHHFMFDEHSFLDLLPAVVDSLDDPIGDQALLPTYWLCREARKYVTVVLSGEGADELFGGYDYYRRSLDRQRWTERLLGWVRGTPPQGGETSLSRNAAPVTPSGFPLVLDAATRQSLIGPVNKDGEDWCHDLFGTLATSGDSIQRATVADLLTWLPDDLLVKLDRMAMAHSLEGRVPFLAPALVETAVRLPAHRKVIAGQSKVALRAVAESLLPPGIAGRAKHGFVLPMAQWIGQWFRQAGDLRRYLDLSRIKQFDTDALARLLKREIEDGCRNERFLFAMIVLVEWHRSFFSRIGTRQEVVSYK
jgi:asparagine synthase (glutamine-hydrolysing)